MFPVTALTQINKREKQQLMDKGVVLCRQLASNHNLLKSLGLSEIKSRLVLSEIDELCKD
jgi:hypothetical protein